MHKYDIIFILVVAGVFLLGSLRGFGKSLKTFAGGIVGIIFSIFVCFMLGGIIRNFEFVQNFIANVNAAAGAKVEFFAKLHLGTVAYYVILFFVVQILRIIVLRLVRKIFESENTAMKWVNRILGGIFSAGITVMFVLLAFAAIRAFFEGAVFADNFLKAIDGSWLLHLYLNNPIKL